MPRFFAKVSRGLDTYVEQELHDMGIKKTALKQGGVFFDASWADCYRVHLCAGMISRILLPVLDFPAYQPDDIYHNLFKHDFTKYIEVEKTVAVKATVRESKLQDQRIVALKTKDALVDQFRNKFGKRPFVSKENPDLRLVVRVVRNIASVSIDLSGEGLFKRGYRHRMAEAPLKETLAHALVKISGWNSSLPLVDPMCGSGTILIEAAMKAQGKPPGILRHDFAFMNLKNFKRDEWNQLLEKFSNPLGGSQDVKIFGSDRDGQVLELAQMNAQRAGVEFISFEKSGISQVDSKGEKGILITNPPYGERLGEMEDLQILYKNLGTLFKTKFKGWTCWVLSGNPELSRHIGLKASLRVPVWNGPIECRFLRYEMR